MIINKLYESVEKNGHVCLGLDTSIDYIPEHFKNNYTNLEELIFNFNKEIIDFTKDIVACYKIQIAYYEALGLKGLSAYKRTLDYIKKTNNIIISDVKRGDIAKTAEMYAKAHFEGDFETDFITINPYMGMDTIEPFLPYIKNKNKGIFILIRTSNKGSKDIQEFTNSSNEKLYYNLGNYINNLSKKHLGKYAYSSIGGVVGCTNTLDAEDLRSKLNNVFFLIPGYGAQGGGANDIKPLLINKNGGIVNSSRGILMAYKKYSNGETSVGKSARKEVIKMRDSIKEVI